MKDKAVEKTELIINAMDYALKHKLDISKEDDVKKILEDIDPEHTSEEEVKEFMSLLQDTDTFMEMTEKNRHKKFDLPN